MHYSPSRLSTFEQCSRKFAFQYLEKPELEEEFESIEAFLGSRVHESLEKLYSLHARGKLLSQEELLEAYNELWGKAWVPEVKILTPGLKASHYKANGEKFLTEYYSRHLEELTAGKLKTVGLEKKLFFSLEGKAKSYKLNGIIDRLSYDSEADSYQVHDYKTSSHLPPQERLDSNQYEGRQLGLYDLAVRSSWPDAKEVSLHWHFLAFDKEMTSQRSADQRKKLVSETVQLIDRIEHSQEKGHFPTQISPLCSYCSYKPLCPAWKHRLKVEGEPLNQFLKEPGVKLVNEYAKVKIALDEYTSQKEAILKELREALLSYAHKHNLEVVKGSEFLLLIKFYETHKLADEDSPEYARLLEALKKAGQFEEYAHFNASQLRNAMESGELAPKAQEALKKALTTKKTEQLKLKEIGEGEK